MSKENIIQIKPLGFPWETNDPFLFCVHHKDAYPKGNDNLGPDTSLQGRNIGNDFVVKDGFRMYHGDTIPGFPVHPHRGFETITIAREGTIDHSDSMGAAGRFSNGDVQWMTAGKGVQHSEMFPMLNKDKENPLEIFQIWLNLPKANKFVEPYFSMLWSESIPVFKTKDNNGNAIKVNVIAGKLNGMKAPPPAPDSWASNPENEIAIWTIKMEPNAKWMLPKAKNKVHRTLYFYKGTSIQIEGESIPSYSAIEVNPQAEINLHCGDEDAYILMLQGKPINEPVAQYGPFVMNTQAEIHQTIADYRQTQFGGWPWPRPDQVHERGKGRFALHANGKIEIKN